MPTKKKTRGTATPKFKVYEVGAHYEWPDGQSDAAYDIINALPQHEVDGAMGTPGQIAKALVENLNDSKTEKWMHDEDVELVIRVKVRLPMPGDTPPRVRPYNPLTIG